MTRRRAIFIAACLLLAYTGQGTVTAQPQIKVPAFRIFPGTVIQTEPVVAVDPLNPSRLFASAVTLDPAKGFHSEGVYLSTDGGETWFGNDSCKGQALFNHGGDPGVAITPDGTLILTHIGNVFNGVYSHRSTDNGLTWSAALTITADQPEDKGTLTIDNSPLSPHTGTLYAAWVTYLNPFPVSVSKSSDAGRSWSTPAIINPGPPARCSGGSIVTGRDGRVYVAWSGMTPASPFIENFAGFASSTDGGTTWSVTQQAFDMNGISGTLPLKGGIRVNGLPRVLVDRSGGPRNDWLYLLTNEVGVDPAGSDPDILLHRSTDGGASWSAGIRVNQDSLSTGNIQYFPAGDVDENGGINIIFYDDRYTTPDSAEIMLARSTDGGDTWMEMPVSNYRFKPKPIGGGSSGYQGDFIDLVCSGSRLNAFWMDDARGVYQVSSTILDLGTAVPGEELRPSTMFLQQNYPNPFNPTTLIEYGLPAQCNVELVVVDPLGRRVATLVDGIAAAGPHTVRWDASGNPAGVYFLHLRAGGRTETKKLLLIR